MIEKETEAWYKMDPDPFDDRHPGRLCSPSLSFVPLSHSAMFISYSDIIFFNGLLNQIFFVLGRADPACALGFLLKSLFKNENIMNKV